MSDVESYREPGGAESGAGSTEKADEILREQIRKAQAAATQAWQDEQKVRVKDSRLAKVMSTFLQSQQLTPLVLLITRLVERNTPSDFLLNLLSLGRAGGGGASGGTAAGQLTGGAGASDPTTPIAITQTQTAVTAQDDNFDPEKLPPEIKAEIDRWISAIVASARTAPQKILLALREPEGGVILSAVQVVAFLLRDFLNTKGLNFSFEKIKSFADFTLHGILARLEAEFGLPELVAGKKEEEVADEGGWDFGGLGGLGG